MIERFVKWYAKKYLCEYTLLRKGIDYFLKEELDGAFERVRSSEAEIQKEFWEHQMHLQKERLERKHFLELTEAQNETKSVRAELEMQKNHQKDVDQLEDKVVRKAQDCVAVVTGVSMRIDSLRDSFADYSGTMAKAKNEMESVYLELGSK